MRTALFRISVLSAAAGIGVYLMNWSQRHFYFVAKGVVTFAESPELPPMSMLIYAVVAGPVVEEWIFRRVVMDGLLRYVSANAALILSSLLFCLAHYQYYNEASNLVSVFLLGLVCGAFYLKSRSLIGPIIVHCTTNALIEWPKSGLYAFLSGQRFHPLRMEVAYVALFCTSALVVVMCVAASSREPSTCHPEKRSDAQ